MTGRPHRCGPRCRRGQSRFREAPWRPDRLRRYRGRPPHGLADHPSPLQTPRRRSGIRPLPLPDPCPLPADPYLGAGRPSPRPGGRPGSLPRRAPRPARLARAGIAQLRQPAPRLQAALAAPPTAAPGPRSLVRPRGLPALPNQSSGFPPRSWRGGTSAGQRRRRGLAPSSGARPSTPPRSRSRLAGVPQIPPGAAWVS